MTDTRLVPLEVTSGTLSWPIKLDEIDYFDVKRVVLNFGAAIVTDENLAVTLKSGIGSLHDFPLLSVPLKGKTGVMLEDIATLMRTDSLLIAFPNSDTVTINGYAVLERTKQNTSGMNTISKVSFPNHDGIVVPREKNGGVPVNVQDQTSPLFDLYFSQELAAPTTLASDVVLETNEITVASATGFVAGSHLGLFSGVSGENRYYFATVVSVSVDTLTMDTPLNFAFSIGDPVVRLSRDMNVNGSATSQVFTVRGGGAGSIIQVDVTKIKLIMTCSGAVDLSLFGDLAALTNGLVLRRTDGTHTNYWNVKNNSQFDLLGTWKPYAATNPAQGVDGALFTYDLAGQDNHGVTSRLSANEYLELIIQDNLSGLVTFQGLAWGHEVTD